MKAAFLSLLGLMGLLTLTVCLAYVPLGPGNLILALGISGTKALLIALVFMELRREEPLVRLAAMLGVVWLGILLILLLVDYASRLPGLLLGK